MCQFIVVICLLFIVCFANIAVEIFYVWNISQKAINSNINCYRCSCAVEFVSELTNTTAIFGHQKYIHLPENSPINICFNHSCLSVRQLALVYSALLHSNATVFNTFWPRNCQNWTEIIFGFYSHLSFDKCKIMSGKRKRKYFLKN